MTKISSVCQCCSMPFMKTEDYGTESDGTKSDLYCGYCYQNGEFTNKDATPEQIAEYGATIISQMYGMPLDKARIFMNGQIKTLKRWSGRIVPSCQSCGMPIISDQDAGTEKDGTLSSMYCVYCYQNGDFTEPSLTQEEMIQKCSPIMAEQFEMTREKAEEMTRVFTTTLSRWK
jgi:hypothetical protein